MQIPPNVLKRFDELTAEGSAIPIGGDGAGNRHVQTGPWHAWVTSALHLLVYTFGEQSVHFRRLNHIAMHASGWVSEKESAIAIFTAARRDLDAGLAGTLAKQSAGEIFGDFVQLAKVALGDGHKDVAAVLACAALEDALKKFAVLNGVSTEGKTMDSVIGGLKSAGHIAGAQKSLVETMPRIRNAAMHADWAKISGPDVASVIGYTEQILIQHFS